MKKLMIAAAIVCAAAFANAATCTWGSGTLYSAAGASGGWSTTTMKTAAAPFTMQVFLFATEDAMTKAIGATTADWYAYSNTHAGDYSGNNNGSTAGTYKSSISVSSSTMDSSTTYYQLVVAKYTDATYGDMYMAKTGTFKTDASGGASNTNIFAPTTYTAGWTSAVPEPTSGLLLILGMAGLALRRRRA